MRALGRPLIQFPIPVSHSFSNLTKLSLWLTCKEKGRRGGDFVGWEGKD